LRAAYFDSGEIDNELWCVDGTIIRAARCTGGGRKKRPRGTCSPRIRPFSRRFCYKIHILSDGKGHPLQFHLTSGQDYESTALVPLLNAADAAVLDGDGEPVAWPVALAADKGCRADWIDDCLLDLEIKPVIPSKENEDRDARPVAFDRVAYRQRNIIERLIGWLKESRRIFTRFEKTAKNFAGMLKMAFIHRYLRLACQQQFPAYVLIVDACC